MYIVQSRTLMTLAIKSRYFKQPLCIRVSAWMSTPQTGAAAGNLQLLFACNSADFQTWPEH